MITPPLKKNQDSATTHVVGMFTLKQQKQHSPNFW